jgi:hypothetical protein
MGWKARNVAHALVIDLLALEVWGIVGCPGRNRTNHSQWPQDRRVSLLGHGAPLHRDHSLRSG